MAPSPPSGTTSLQQEFGGLYAFARDVTETALSQSAPDHDLKRVSAKLERLAEKEISRLHERLEAMGERGSHLKPACSKGCWFCCTHVVMATVPEILHLAAHIRSSWSGDEIGQLREAISRHKSALEEFRAGDATTLPRVACPLLREGICSAWTFRPFVCRGWNSVKIEDCRSKMESPDADLREQGFAPQVAVADFIRQGMSDALRAKGMDGELCELALALEIALDHPDAETRYASGEDLFAPAQAGFAQWS